MPTLRLEKSLFVVLARLPTVFFTWAAGISLSVAVLSFLRRVFLSGRWNDLSIPIPLVQKKTSRILLLLKKPNKAFSFAFARISEDCFLYPSNLPFPCHPLTVFSTFAVLTRAQPQQLQQLSSASPFSKKTFLTLLRDCTWSLLLFGESFKLFSKCNIACKGHFTEGKLLTELNQTF